MYARIFRFPQSGTYVCTYVNVCTSGMHNECIYEYVFIRGTHVYIYIYIYARIFRFPQSGTDVCIYVDICTCVYMYIHLSQ